MQIHHSNSSPTHRAPESTFTGDVQLGGYFQRATPSNLSGATVTCAPGSRTPWKINPLGQTLIVLSGTGWAQCDGEDIVEIGPGDVVWCPPGQRHWDGATPDDEVTYVAMHEGTVEFAEPVTDEQYGVGPGGG